MRKQYVISNVMPSLVIILLFALLSPSLALGQPLTSVASGPPFIHPVSLTVSPDGNTLYIGDFGAQAIFTVPATGGTPSLLASLASTGFFGFNGLRGISISPDGTTLYVAGWETSSIFSVSTATGLPTLLFAGGPLNRPHGITVSPDGATLYIVDNYGHSVFSLPAVGGTPNLLISGLVEPLDITVSHDNTTLFFTDAGPSCIYSMPATGGVPVVVASGTPLVRPTGISISPCGSTLFIVDDAELVGEPPAAIYKVPATGGLPIALYSGLPLRTPAFGEITADGSSLFIADAGHFGPGTIYKLSLILNVSIDIKPGSYPNTINPKSKGVISVAILTTNDFDATTVDPLSIKFGPNGALEFHGKGHIEDVDGDGDIDMVLHFNTQMTGIQYGDTKASLSGKTIGGQAITGMDAIQTVGVIPKESAEVQASLPEGYALFQNHPNPFNPSTTIKFTILKSSFVTLKVFDLIGREVSSLVNEEKVPDTYDVKFNGDNLSSGIYFYRLQAGDYSETKKLLLLK